MSVYYPDCPASRPDTPLVVSITAEACQFWGICDRLRACEQRSYALGIEVGKHDGWIAGYAAGVQAAREAAEIALLGTLQSTRDRVLAAIDGLRGESNG